MDISQEEYETLAGFRYALRRFLRFSEDAVAGVGLSPQQHQALLAVRGWGGDRGVTVGTLAERLQIQQHSAVGLVDRLEAKGLVQRTRDEADHRCVLVGLTEEGASLLAQLSAIHRRELSQLGPHLIALLQKLVEEEAGKV